MRGRGNFKSRVLSSQKPRKRRAKANQGRYRVDLIELHRNITEAKRRRRPTRTRWVGRTFLALMVILGFFLLGYLIAALSVPTWAKALLFTLIAFLGFMSSYILAILLH